MGIRPTLAVAVLAMLACTPTPEPIATTTTAAVTTTSPTIGTSGANTSSASSPTTTTTEPTQVRALVSPKGVTVAVLEQLEGNRFLVLTPCGFEAEVEEGRLLGPTQVVVDPGHGGPTDTGAVGANGLAEKAINLEVARLVVAELETRGVGAVLTRTGDYTSPLFVRAHLADTLEAELMVSIHHNAPTPGPSERPGIEIFIQRESDASARLGGLLWEHTQSALGSFDVAWTAADDSGVMTVLNSRGDDAYGILRHPETTTALVELGYLSNRAEAEFFDTAEYPPAAAVALADAIERFLSTDETGSGFVEGRVFNPRPGVSQDVCEDPELN